jgi:epoxyqueuosine reductase QueG
MVAEQMVTVAKAESVPVFGIGPAAEMADAPPGFRPADFIADVQSIVCFGIPIPGDVFNTPNFCSKCIAACPVGGLSEG